jgi:hypothetical protein
LNRPSPDAPSESYDVSLELLFGRFSFDPGSKE